MKSVTPVMRAALHVACKNNGRLKRYEGESWAGDEVVPLEGRPAWFTSRTVQALVDRGLMEYTAPVQAGWDAGMVPVYNPAEVTLTEAGAALANR